MNCKKVNKLGYICMIMWLLLSIECVFDKEYYTAHLSILIIFFMYVFTVYNTYIKKIKNTLKENNKYIIKLKKDNHKLKECMFKTVEKEK